MSAKEGQIRWGFASAGKICHDFANAINILPREEHQLAAVAARSKERAADFATEFGFARSYGSYEELASDPDIDVVYVGVIHPAHFDVTAMMMNAGKNVLCEKPLTMNARQAEEIIKLAKDRGVFLMEAFWSRFFPIYHTLRETLESGELGKLKFISVNFGKKTSRIYENILGGGALMDLGCYPVMLSTMLSGEPARICANSTHLTKGVDLSECITLYYESGAVAQLNVSAEVELDNTATIYGTKGMIKIPNFWHPTEMITPTKTYSYPLPTAAKKMNYGGGEGFIYEAAHVRDCLLKGLKESPLMPHKDTLIQMNILDEVRRQIGLHYKEDDA